jgi:hypothetical protein
MKAHARIARVASRTVHRSTIRWKWVAYIPAPVSLHTDRGRGYTLEIVAACSRTLIVLSSRPQLNHYNDWLKLPV